MQTHSPLPNHAVDPALQPLHALVATGCGALLVPTSEEPRLTARIESWIDPPESPDGLHGKLYRWSASRGVVAFERAGDGQTGGWGNAIPDSKPIQRALEWATEELKDDRRYCLVLADVRPFLAVPEVVRLIRELAWGFRRRRHLLVLISPSAALPEELQEDVMVCEFPLPGEADLAHEVTRRYRATTTGDEESEAELPPELRGEVVRSLRGLTLSAARNALALALYERADRWDPGLVQALYRQRRTVVRRTDGLEFVSSTEEVGGIGGLDVFKEWLGSAALARSTAARARGIAPPRGVTLAGAPGTGKSLAAKAMAHALGLPLYRLEVATIFEGGLVGDAERNMRRMLRTLDSLGEGVVWADEIADALAGANGGGSGSSEVTRKVVGMLLTWMQERSSGVVLTFTANRLNTLPPQLLRPPRIDEVFVLDLPNSRDRREILRIHLLKRGLQDLGLDLEAAVHASEGFAPSEIEHAINTGMLLGLANGDQAPLSTPWLLEAMNRTIPVSVREHEQIAVMVQMVAEGRARSASRGDPVNLAAVCERYRQRAGQNSGG